MWGVKGELGSPNFNVPPDMSSTRCPFLDLQARYAVPGRDGIGKSWGLGRSHADISY